MSDQGPRLLELLLSHCHNITVYEDEIASPAPIIIDGEFLLDLKTNCPQLQTVSVDYESEQSDETTFSAVYFTKNERPRIDVLSRMICSSVGELRNVGSRVKALTGDFTGWRVQHSLDITVMLTRPREIQNVTAQIVRAFESKTPGDVSVKRVSLHDCRYSLEDLGNIMTRGRKHSTPTDHTSLTCPSETNDSIPNVTVEHLQPFTMQEFSDFATQVGHFLIALHASDVPYGDEATRFDGDRRNIQGGCTLYDVPRLMNIISSRFPLMEHFSLVVSEEPSRLSPPDTLDNVALSSWSEWPPSQSLTLIVNAMTGLEDPDQLSLLSLARHLAFACDSIQLVIVGGYNSRMMALGLNKIVSYFQR